MRVLVTGSNGFIGRNLVAWLERRSGIVVLPFDQDDTGEALHARLAAADFVYHLAGVNRPQDEAEFRTGNVDLTAGVCDTLLSLGKATPVVLASSIQATLDNPYGASKRAAEEVVASYAQRGGRAVIYRLANVFGKWCRPNYNSVVATFCYNVARDLPVAISDPAREIDLVHVDNVVEHFLRELDAPISAGLVWREVTPVRRIALGALAELIRSFGEMRRSLLTPDLADPFVRKLYGTYLSYLPEDGFAYALDVKRDARGSLAELLKSPHFGQIFVSRTQPGASRGHHFHHTKTEKFAVLAGEAAIRFQHIRGGDVIEHRVRGEEFRVVDIPPGYTHSIENTGPGELVMLIWASEVFDPDRPDTLALPVGDAAT